MATCLAETCAAASAGPSAIIFTQLIHTLLTAQCALKSDQVYPPDRTDEILKNNLDFDFIVVGSGTAGSTVAARLSEQLRWRVLLIERGVDPSPLSDIPALLLLLQGTKEDYSYKVKPDKRYCLGMKNKQCIWAKGKVLGGSSVINAMLHVRGNDRDYDNWAKMGNDGWSFEELLPYFKKSENYHPDIVAKHGTRLFGTGGPITLRTYNYSESGLHDILMDVVNELNIPLMDMLNGEQYIGYGLAYGTVDNGVRQSVAKGYLSPAKDRSNLYVMKSTRVDSIVIVNNKAIGVKVTLKNGQNVELKASKEVIVSAGTIASPQILMLSGIGPKEHLKNHKIKVLADLPVGKNLQDHIIWLGIHVTYNNITAQKVTPTFMYDWAYEYLISRRGEFASAGGVDFLGYFNTRDSNGKYPNIQFHHTQVPKNQVFKIDALFNAFHFSEEMKEVMRDLIKQGEIFFACPTLLNPQSYGELKLKSTNPEDQIEIHANYFDARQDVEQMLEAVNIVKSFVNTQTFRKLGAQLRPMNISGCTQYPIDSKNYWECNLRHTSGTVYHPVGTCKMGPAGSKDSVVDPTLKVHNIRGLRVIDASIMPKIPSGNTHAPTLMIAEKGADMIKQEWLAKDEL
ncbi:glucose dehydrogenase [FAD, quinone]-like [Phymastichus coffea]|uniref:glucose dehydrogenase [FAD, quinone]-like n=1 Tax=Phymastichus coffea TaxID=108790 RepID=UPI00273B7A95|nr:glucose dehydrogenase [FAD, quinone]-like [Phymastichus coffea]